jgi:lipopolysaccharide assembly protein A
MPLQLVAALIIVFLIVVFAIQNAVAVSIVFFLWRIDASLTMVIATCFGLGVLIGALLAVPAMLRERLSISRLRKQVEALRVENDNLRELKKHESSVSTNPQWYLISDKVSGRRSGILFKETETQEQPRLSAAMRLQTDPKDGWLRP